MVRIFVFLGLFASPFSAWADVVWRGDFETGDRSQWSGAEMVNADRLQVVNSPVRGGNYSLKVTVRQGDDPIHSSGNRNELFYSSFERLGSEYYYRWSTLFDDSFPSYPSWQLFTQWHQNADCCGSPPVEFYVNGENIYLRVGPTDNPPIWNTPLVRGVWYDFIFHVRWSDNPSVGFVELYLNGDLVLPRTPAATNVGGLLNYLKQGLYRDSRISTVGILYHAGMVQATSLDDVLPPPPPPPPPPPEDAGVPPATDSGLPPADSGTPHLDGGAAGSDGGGIGTPDGGVGTSTLSSPPGSNNMVATGGCSHGTGQAGALALAMLGITFGFGRLARRLRLQRPASKLSEGADRADAQ